MTREAVDKLFDTIGPRLATARVVSPYYPGGFRKGDGGKSLHRTAGSEKFVAAKRKKSAEVRSKRVEAAKKVMEENQAEAEAEAKAASKDDEEAKPEAKVKTKKTKEGRSKPSPGLVLPNAPLWCVFLRAFRGSSPVDHLNPADCDPGVSSYNQITTHGSLTDRTGVAAGAAIMVLLLSVAVDLAEPPGTGALPVRGKRYSIRHAKVRDLQSSARSLRRTGSAAMIRAMRDGNCREILEQWSTTTAESMQNRLPI